MNNRVVSVTVPEPHDITPGGPEWKFTGIFGDDMRVAGTPSGGRRPRHGRAPRDRRHRTVPRSHRLLQPADGTPDRRRIGSRRRPRRRRLCGLKRPGVIADDRRNGATHPIRLG